MARAEKSPKREPKLSKKAQYERFVETARKLGSDESIDAFEAAFLKIVRPTRRKTVPKSRE